MLILRINEQVYGTIVDKIDKVVGINHEAIQPPHPIFGDINIKFISGVVEKQGDLYIILDVVRIFTVSDDEKKQSRAGVADSGEFYVPPPSAADQAQAQRAAVTSAIGFIQESLAVLRQFFVSKLNEGWLQQRFSEWSVGRSGEALQIQSSSEANHFLETFFSPCNGEFWSDSYANAVKKVLPEIKSASINIWNIGCGKGYESFSFACILRSMYPNAQIKIWANDSDIMAISQAPSVVFDLEEVPEYCREYVVAGKSGYSFNQTIKDTVVFEYHDVLNDDPLPGLDMILVRDVLSFLSEQDQTKLVNVFKEKLKPRGFVITGKNEELSGDQWDSQSRDSISVFVYNA